MFEQLYVCDKSKALKSLSSTDSKIEDVNIFPAASQVSPCQIDSSIGIKANVISGEEIIVAIDTHDRVFAG